MGFLWSHVDGTDMEDMWYQQDGATCHSARETTELFQRKFLAVSSHALAIRICHRGRAIWHRATTFFGGLWNLVSMSANHKQSRVYVSKPQTISCLCQQTTNNLVSMSANHKQSRVYVSKPQTIPELKAEIRLSLTKLGRNYVEMSSRVSSKEQECASRVVGDICQLLCSTINRSVCTL